MLKCFTCAQLGAGEGHISQPQQSVLISVCRVAVVSSGSGEGGMVNLLDVICGITGFDRGEQTSLSVTDGRTPKMPPDSKTTAISKLQSTAEVN